MKKILTTIAILAVIACVPSISSTTTAEREIHLHNHAEAASITWQCRKCGERIYGGTQPPNQTYWCGGVFENKHIWERLN